MYDFQARMAEGRAIAKRRTERYGSSPYQAYANERQRFATMSDDDWHARFADDEAFANEVAGGVDAPPAVSHQQTEKEKPMRRNQTTGTTGDRQSPALSSGKTMTGATYKKLLAKLDLSHDNGWSTLGISRRTSYRYAQDELPIPVTVVKLLRAMVKLGTTEV